MNALPSCSVVIPTYNGRRLLETCLATRAKQVLLTHGYSDALARYLNERGVNAGALATSFGDEE